MGMKEKLLGTPGTVAAAAWGFAEATLFFVIPDVLFTLTALFSWRASLRQIAAAIAGAVLGGALMFSLGAGDFNQARALVLRVPFVPERMFTKTHAELEQSGLTAVFKGPASGIPYKVYAVQAPRYASLPKFLLITVPARLERFLITWIVALLAAVRFRRFIERRPGLFVGIHAVVWGSFYAVYWSMIGLAK